MYGMLSKSALIGGIVLSLIGTAGIITYLVGVIDIVFNQPADRSWLFWGFAFFAFGVIALGGGIALLVVWYKQRRDEKLSAR